MNDSNVILIATAERAPPSNHDHAVPALRSLAWLPPGGSIVEIPHIGRVNINSFRLGRPPD